jgi:hypothetical protein
MPSVISMRSPQQPPRCKHPCFLTDGKFLIAHTTPDVSRSQPEKPITANKNLLTLANSPYSCSPGLFHPAETYPSPNHDAPVRFRNTRLFPSIPSSTPPHPSSNVWQRSSQCLTSCANGILRPVSLGIGSLLSIRSHHHTITSKNNFTPNRPDRLVMSFGNSVTPKTVSAGGIGRRPSW